MIRVKNLNKYFNKGQNNEIHVINDTTLTLPSEGLISFLGQSGSGKTTLLNVIGGLDKASGSIEYDNLALDKYRMRKIDDYRREEIGYVFQGYNLLTEETVYNNLVIALEMVNVYDKDEQAKRIEYVLKAVGMYKYRKKKASALSGGQQQRVSIARALVKSSKIIIADEPTGNLDHENTITIMNILKKISKNTLVLMVTHNEEIAEFYSDRIFKIADGRITTEYIPSGGSLSNKASNNIYLKDMQLESIEGNGASIAFYSDNPNDRLDLRIAYKNGTYYLESSSNIKLVEGSNIKLLDKHYEELTKDALDDFTYDNSWFKADSKKKNYFKSFIENIKISYHNMKAKRRRTKILYFSFGIIGILVALCMISLSNVFVVDDSSFQLDDKKSVVYMDDPFDRYPDNYVLEAVRDGYIEDINAEWYLSATMRLYKTLVERVDISFNSATHENDLSLHKLIKGRDIKENNEIIIAKGLADYLITSSQNILENYDDLLGKEIEASNTDKDKGYVIVGINDNPYKMVYLSEYYYLDGFNYYHEDNDRMVIRSYQIENKYKGYHITEGRDLDSSDIDNCLIPYSLKGNYKLNNTIMVMDRAYTIVGFYEGDSFKTNNSSEVMIPKISSLSTYAGIEGCYNNKDISLATGRLPRNNKEVIASIYTSLKVGDMIDGLYKVVGLYNCNGDSDTMGRVLYTKDIYLTYTNRGGFIDFKVVNQKDFKNLLGDDYSIMNAYDAAKKRELGIKNGLLGMYLTFALILIAIITIFIYFIMRSRMISEIYPLGVYRSLGASKGRIYKRYLYDILVIVTLTSVIGYLLTLLLYSGLASGINSLIGATVIKNSLFFGLGGILVMYLLNIIFGLLPAYILMRKTPAEILSKYDI